MVEGTFLVPGQDQGRKSQERNPVMALNMTIVPTAGIATTHVPDDIAADLLEAYEALAPLPASRAVVVDFDTAEEAKKFVKQGKAWAMTQTGPNNRPLKFTRKGNAKELPTRVMFRIYESDPPKTGE